MIRNERENEETKFLAALRQPGANKPLQEIAKGLFRSKSYPLDYAYGLTVGAGLVRCECGLWGDVDDLTENNIPIPCPHEIEQEELCGMKAALIAASDAYEDPFWD